MIEHVGRRVKHLVDNKYNGNNIEFSKAIGLEAPNHLYKIFKQEDISTSILRKISGVLKIPVSEILSETDSPIQVAKNTFDKKAKVVIEFSPNDVLNLNIDIKKRTLEILKHK